MKIKMIMTTLMKYKKRKLIHKSNNKNEKKISMKRKLNKKQTMTLKVTPEEI